MNRSLLYGALAGFVLAVLAVLVALRTRPVPAGAPVPALAPAQLQPQAGRYQLVSSIEILMLDTATGELWFYRKGKWHRAASSPHDDGDRSAVLGELEEERGDAEVAEPETTPPGTAAAAAPAEDRGRAEVIQVETAPEKPERPARRR